MNASPAKLIEEHAASHPQRSDEMPEHPLESVVAGERFRQLVESVVDYAIFVIDPTGHIQTWNAGAQRIKGYRADEVIGQHFSRFYPDDSVQRGWPAYELQEAARMGRFEDEGWRVRKDGSQFWANVVITALHNEAGQLTGFAKITRDLTERRAHEEALRQSEERFRLLIEATADYAIFMLDSNGCVLTWNSGAARIKGYQADEIIGQHFSKFYPAEVAQRGWPAYELQQATEQGRFEDEGWRIRKDGSRFWANVIITPLRDASGQVHGFAKVTRDLSERRRSEALERADVNREHLLEAERRARIEAQRAVQIKDDFLATLSHELRTPLNAILGWAQVFKGPRRVGPEEIARGTDAIERNARAQVQLIDDLLDLSRIMAGHVRLDVQQLMVSTVVQAAIESAEPAAAAKGIRLDRVVDPSAGPVSGDPARLQQVVWNLLSNAIKFTPKGGRVQVIVERVNSHVELSVTDTGVGISPEFLPHVFDRFSQQDSSTSRAYGGLGLGLAIAKQLAELHGATLRAKSAGAGRGASFMLDLPLTLLLPGDQDTGRFHPTRSAGSEVSTLLPDLTGARVLVVDDDTDGIDLVKRVLEGQGAIVTTLTSGEEALHSLQEGARPDVLISDVGMPGMDGYQLIRAIRTSDGGHRRLLAVALTAFARAEDRKKALLAGYQAHLAKPVDISELVIVVASLIGRSTP